MMLFLQSIWAAVVLCPVIAFIVVLFVCKKLRMNKYKAIGMAADVTTGILFFSIPIALQGLWEIGVFMPMLIAVLIIAIVFTYIDWRTKKEVEVKPLLKKIWRIYFLLFSTAYLFIWIAGMTHSVMIFLMVE